MQLTFSTVDSTADKRRVRTMLDAAELLAEIDMNPGAESKQSARGALRYMGVVDENLVAHMSASVSFTPRTDDQVPLNLHLHQWAFIRMLVVAPGWRSCGVGPKMIAEFSAVARAAGCMQLGLRLDTRTQVDRRRHAFENCGFKFAGTPSEFGYLSL